MSQHPGRILIVDDDPAARLSLQALLEESFEVIAAASAAESWLAAGPVDVIVSDYEMPSDTGLALLRRVSERYPGIAGILLTGHGGLPEVRGAKGDGSVFMVLQKSYHPQFIVGWVKNAAQFARTRQHRLSRKKE